MKIDWMKRLGWNEDHLEEFRYAGYSYIRQGKYSTALPFFEALCILTPDNAYDLQTLGALYVQLNQPQQAIRYLERALQLETDHSPILLNLAKAFFMLNKQHEAARLAGILTTDKNPFIAAAAQALLLAHSTR